MVKDMVRVRDRAMDREKLRPKFGELKFGKMKWNKRE